MIINQANLKDLLTAYSAAFQGGLAAANGDWQKIATEVPSSTRENHYAWLGQFPKLREWVGDRQVKNLAAYDYSIKNRKFESTVSVPRDDIEDDQYGVYTPLMREMGDAAKTHPDELIWDLLANGRTSLCYDGQNFFDTQHPVAGVNVANLDSGGGGNGYWYLLDCSRSLKPLILQTRRAYDFRAITNLQDDAVFTTDEFKFGVDGRLSAGFGFWQQAYASNKALDSTNFNSAWNAMMAFKSDEGRPLGIRPTHLVVGAANRSTALALIEAMTLSNGASNINYKAVEVIVSPYLT